MSPIKLLVIAALLYLGYRLFISDWKKKKGNDKADSSTGNTQDNGRVEDVLVEDPVCHSLVPKQQAIRLKKKGTEGYYYFCSEKCCNQFVSNTGEQQ